LQVALLRDEALVLLLSPTQRQCFDADTVVLDRRGRAMRICDHPDAWPTGTRLARRYTVWGGASVVVTDNHPLWGERGWVEAGELRPGDRIAVMSAWPRWESAVEVSGRVPRGWKGKGGAADVSFPVTPELGKLIGYMMTDGCHGEGRQSNVKFANTRREHLDEVAALSLSVTGTPGRRRAGDDLMRVLAWDRGFPTDLFRFPPDVAAAAVNRAWSGDGCVRVTACGFPEIFLACENEVYARYFHLLLLKLGVRSSVKREWGKKATRPHFRLSVCAGRLNVERFFGVVGLIYGKEGRSRAALEAVQTGRNRAMDHFKQDHVGEDGEEFHLARITKIEDVGERQVWDISVPGKGWLVAQGVKAHNSGELFRHKMMWLYERLGRPVKATQETALTLMLANGSRVVSLPGSEAGIVGYSAVSLLVIDEAARVPDTLYYSVRPMLAVSQGRLAALSTPLGKRGWFYEEWTGANRWDRVRVEASSCPRISPEFLAEERKALGDRWYRQEYECHLPATRVLLADGREKAIVDVAAGDSLWCAPPGSPPKPCRVTRVWPVGEKPITRVVTEIGTVFSASSDHPVVTGRGRLPLSLAGDLHYVPRPAYSSDPQEALARLVGHNMGDGTVCARPSGRYQASWYGNGYADMARVAADLHVSGLRDEPASVLRKKARAGKPDTWQVHASGRAAAALVSAGCPIGKKKHAVFGVPPWVARGPAGVRREFIAALFGAEGATPIRSAGSGKRCNQPVLSMWKAREADGVELFDGLRTLLEWLGVRASVTRRDVGVKGWSFHLRVGAGADNIKRFYDLVGYRYAAAKELLAFQWSAYYGAYLHDAASRKARVRAMRASGLTYEATGRKLGCRAGVAHQLCVSSPSQPRRDFPAFADWVASRWRGGGLLARVVDRQECDASQVYNIEVDSPDHSYLLADGLNNYNCSFEETTDSLFSSDQIADMLAGGESHPAWTGGEP
jgi:intein/homing endonuclease